MSADLTALYECNLIVVLVVVVVVVIVKLICHKVTKIQFGLSSNYL